MKNLHFDYVLQRSFFPPYYNAFKSLRKITTDTPAGVVATTLPPHLKSNQTNFILKSMQNCTINSVN